MTTSLEQCPQSFADEGVRATLAKPARRGAPRSECMSSNLISAAALIVPRMSAAKNWRELVPSLSGLVHGMGMLPSTSVPGFQVPPLRGWVMVPERLRCDSSAASGEPLFMERHKTGVVRIGTCRFISSPPRHFRTRLSYSAASRLKNAPL